MTDYSGTLRTDEGKPLTPFVRPPQPNPDAAALEAILEGVAQDAWYNGRYNFADSEYGKWDGFEKWWQDYRKEELDDRGGSGVGTRPPSGGHDRGGGREGTPAGSRRRSPGGRRAHRRRNPQTRLVGWTVDYVDRKLAERDRRISRAEQAVDDLMTDLAELYELILGPDDLAEAELD